jgi:rSAM/selenodomain-associated transferase 1
MRSCPNATGRPVLGLFVKQPQDGLVKTRLAANVSGEWATCVAHAFLLDTVERLSGIEAHRILVFAPPPARAFFAQVTKGRFTLIPQTEGDLGKRMAAFIAEQLHDGVDSVVVVGADTPTLPTAFVERAFRELAEADVVIGPAKDGGYYLIGCARRLPPIFDGIDWGTSRVFSATLKRLAHPDWRVALLPPWYDVDTLDDWRILQSEVTALRGAGIDPGVPNTERLLRAPFP